MSKIFRLYTGGSGTYQDWNANTTFPYNSTNRDTIDDPDGASASHEITSIPSPFARIDLVKTAFREVCRSGNLDGDTIFHKMVSDALDVGEIFFNIDRLGDAIEIIKWNSTNMIQQLLNSSSVGHKYFGDSLQKYLLANAQNYNFNLMGDVYLLNYLKGRDGLNIIGATSPSTLFFSSANDLSYVKGIHFGQDIPFDKSYRPLYMRDFDYVKYFIALRAAKPNFVTLFPEINDYLDLTYRLISNQMQRDELMAVSPNTLNEFLPINVNGTNMVNVVGVQLYKKRMPDIPGMSRFILQSTRNLDRLPLVLPVEKGNRYSWLQYTTDTWGDSNSAPYVDNEDDLSRRKLPADGWTYPYLTISDFLEDTIVSVPHKLNDDNYFDGNLRGGTGEYSYLLPIKPLVFKYFTPEEIRGALPDNQPMFEMSILAGGGVKVILRIPINGATSIPYVEYSRIYYGGGRTANAQRNEGSVKEFNFTGFVMPQVKFRNVEDAIYNISCIQAAGRGQRIKFDFYSYGEEVMPRSCTCRDEGGQSARRMDNYMIENRDFECVRVSENECAGILLPVFKTNNGNEQYKFAIDLGTSNTHIECLRVGANAPEPFSFTASDRQLCEMFVPTRNEYGNLDDLISETDYIEKDYIPSEIGNGDYKFPTRTVLSCARTIDWTYAIDPFTLVNLPFTYDKRDALVYNNYKCNIKWDSDNDEITESYVRCLLLIVRNKVLLNDGDLSRTKITWFYPISMSPSRRRKLSTIWNNSFEKYFRRGVETVCMTESAAPIKYFFRLVPTASDMVSVDIGGGTTDIAFAKGGRINYVTSFKFASNALFEDAFMPLNNTNGIVDWYKGRFLTLFGENEGLGVLQRAMEYENNVRPSNMASFLFGLKNNTILEKAGINERLYDFNYILQQDEEFKIVFIIFYTSIIYHIAQIIKVLNLKVPRHISFSGNGSKVVNVVADEEVLVDYTKLVFEKVLNFNNYGTLEFLGLGRNANPKETTCKGGIVGEGDGNEGETIVLKSDSSGLVGADDTYQRITEEYKRGTIEKTRIFFDFVLEELNRDFDFGDNFGVSPNSIAIARQVSNSGDLMTFLNNGISHNRLDIETDDERIEETFFFYPIKGVLQSISAEIYRSLNAH